ncbi:MAG: hypothetical protein HY883_03560 [Deltaproteobacteria bacterium]|nr:hypothetical protein [Deltaproteobacteria bacterium]
MRMIPLLSSIGFIFAVMTFVGGFRTVRKTEHHESLTHRVNGFCTFVLYIIIATVSISRGVDVFYSLAWFAGFVPHLFKIFLVRKGLAVKYGGYVGTILLIIWLTIIYTHLPS